MAARAIKATVDQVRTIPLFGDISEESASRLAGAATLRQCAARTILFREDSAAANLIIVLKGSVELFSEHDDRYCTLAVVAAIRPLALSAMLSGHNSLSARVLEPADVVSIPAELIAALAEEDAGFANALRQQLVSEGLELIEDFKSHRLRSTVERVAHWMLRGDRTTGDTGHIMIPFDKRVLASYLGMAPEHLSRSFSALASAGVEVNGRSVTLSDRAALSEIAREDVPERFLRASPQKKSS